MGGIVPTAAFINWSPVRRATPLLLSDHYLRQGIALCFSLEERFTAWVWPPEVYKPLQHRFARAVDAHQEVPSCRGIQPVGHLAAGLHDPKNTVNVPSAFSFTFEELTLLFSLFMKPSLP